MLTTKAEDQFGMENSKYISSMILHPALNAFAYDYIYKNFYASKYASTIDSRTKKTNMLIGAASGLTN